MSKPIDVKGFGPDAQLELQSLIEAAIVASQGSSTPFLTGEEAIPAQTPTQLSAQASPSGFMLRVEDDVYINSSNAASGGMIVYEGDDIPLENVTDLDQVWVTTIKNSATTVRWMTL